MALSNRDRVGRAFERLAVGLRAFGTAVRVTVEIEARADEPFPDATVRTVSENAETLEFEVHGFEAS